MGVKLYVSMSGKSWACKKIKGMTCAVAFDALNAILELKNVLIC